MIDSTSVPEGETVRLIARLENFTGSYTVVAGETTEGGTLLEVEHEEQEYILRTSEILQDRQVSAGVWTFELYTLDKYQELTDGENVESMPEPTHSPTKSAV